jgi:hypothetical protein
VNFAVLPEAQHDMGSGREQGSSDGCATGRIDACADNVYQDAGPAVRTSALIHRRILGDRFLNGDRFGWDVGVRYRPLTVLRSVRFGSE